MAQQVDLAQAHGIEKITDGGRMLGHSGSRGRRVRIAEAGQVRGEDRAAEARDREEAPECSPGRRARMQAQERRALLEAAPRGNRIVDVQLAVAALEIATADTGAG